MPQAFIGIDPGLSGACAVYVPGSGRVDVVDMPCTTAHTDGLVKRRVDGTMLANWLRSVIHEYAFTRGDVLAVVELVGAMGTDGRASLFAFGAAAGVIDGVLGALNMDSVHITPQTWKRHFWPDGANGKEASLERARKAFPDVTGLRRKKDHNRAEALLLALYGVEALA